MEIQDGSAKFKAEFNPIMPNGSIITFSGSFTEEGYPIDNQTGVVYTNWHVCNGEEGTVDLRGKFILGSSDTHEIGEVGGEETHTLTTEEMPSHRHGYYCDENYSIIVTGSTNSWKYPLVIPGGESPVNSYQANWEGGSQPHNNMPPYYALAYMQKI